MPDRQQCLMTSREQDSLRRPAQGKAQLRMLTSAVIAVRLAQLLALPSRLWLRVLKGGAICWLL